MFYLDVSDPDPVLLSRECIATLSCFFPLVRIFTNLSATKHCLTANQENKFSLSPKQRVRSSGSQRSPTPDPNLIITV